MKTIIIANQKGGVGKTTTTAALASGFKRKGFRVLIIDSDPQGNLTAALGLDPETTKGLREVLCDNFPIKDVVQNTFAGDLVSCSIMFADADRCLTQAYAISLLKRKLDEIQEEYDYCFIDAPPSLGILSLNGFNAADYLIIPVNASAFSLQGLSSLMDIINEVRTFGKHRIEVCGILLTRYNKITRISKEALESLKQLAARYETKVFNSKISQSVCIEEAQAQQCDLFECKTGKAVTDYFNLIEEVFNSISV